MLTNTESLRNCAHMTGALKEWYYSLGPVRKDELHVLNSIDIVIVALHHEFLGDHTLVQKEIRKEYFDVKCCSLKKLNLEHHFKRMAQRFYQLNGYNDLSLKTIYVSSLREELQAEMYQMITAMQRDIVNMTLGEIHQTCLAELDKLCSQQVLFENIIKDRKKYTKACKKNYLEIKFKGRECSCCYKLSVKKWNKVFISKKGKKNKVRFFKRQPYRGKDSKRCFICEKRFSKNCPNKKEKASKLIHSLDLVADEDIESWYDNQDQPDASTAFGLEYTNSSYSSKSDSSNFEEQIPVMQAKEIAKPPNP